MGPRARRPLGWRRQPETCPLGLARTLTSFEAKGGEAKAARRWSEVETKAKRRAVQIYIYILIPTVKPEAFWCCFFPVSLFSFVRLFVFSFFFCFVAHFRCRFIILLFVFQYTGNGR